MLSKHLQPPVLIYDFFSSENLAGNHFDPGVTTFIMLFSAPGIASTETPWRIDIDFQPRSYCLIFRGKVWMSERPLIDTAVLPWLCRA